MKDMEGDDLVSVRIRTDAIYTPGKWHTVVMPYKDYKKNYDKALKLIEDIISKYEKSEIFKDDAVSEYHCFREPMEEILFCEYTKPEKDISCFKLH